MYKPTLRTLAISIAAGAVAGLAGSLALTGTEWVEKQAIGRDHGHIGAEFVEETTGAKAQSETELRLLDNAVHYSYGASWGALRGLMTAFGLGGAPAFLLHWVGVDVAAKLFLPMFGLAPTIDKRSPRNMAIDSAHHAIYALVVGVLINQMKKMGHPDS